MYLILFLLDGDLYAPESYQVSLLEFYYQQMSDYIPILFPHIPRVI